MCVCAFMCVYKGVPVNECVSIYRQELCLGSLTVTHCLREVVENIACIVKHFYVTMLQ